MIETMVCVYHMVQGNSVCYCWRRAILHKRGIELLRSVHCSSGKIGSNHWSRPKKDTVSMFDGLFFVDHAELSDSSV